MTWATTSHVDRFLAQAERFLAADPVANSVLLTEAHFWRRLPEPEPGARFGWWAQRDDVRAAFVHLPDHPVLLSPLDAASIAELPLVLTGASAVGVPAKDVVALSGAWRDARGESPRPAARLTMLKLRELVAQTQPAGAPRVADPADLPLLRSWFGLFRERHPDDPSHVEFVIDQPLQQRSIVLWEVQGQPVAMASRTPVVAGMTRMGLAFQPTDGTALADAAFAAACEHAARSAPHVLVLSGSPDATSQYRSLGFEPVLDRVLLHVPSAVAPGVGR